MLRRSFILRSLAMSAIPLAWPVSRALADDRAQSQSASERLRAAFAASDEAYLRNNPVFGLFRGDRRFAHQFGDYLSDEYYAAERSAAERDLAAVDAIDRSLLSPAEQVSADAFAWAARDRLASLAPAILAASAVRPIDHKTGFHIRFPEASSGQSYAPFRSLADYESNLSRMDGYASYLERSIYRFRQGIASGVVQPRLVVDNVIAQLDLQLAAGVDKSLFLQPLQRFPDEVAQADRARLSAAYAAKVQDVVLPATQRLRDFLAEEYLPLARDSVGLGDMPGGDAFYRRRVAAETTTDLSPEDIHALGLSEVARVRAEMEAIKARVGFAGTLTEFFEDIRTNPAFKVETPQQMAELYARIGERVEAALPKLFNVIPKSDMAIMPTPAVRERGSAGGDYQPGAADGSRPGVFYFNTYDLPSRTTIGTETLYLHEAKPGHHFQFMIAIENDALPAFQRFSTSTAFLEGWALYAESLGEELGMFSDPYQRLGHLDAEMLRAMRLVVDTGIHAFGWSRERAIEYMLANSATGRTAAAAEVERYIANPGQALAYKIGQITIRNLRTRAEERLGARFDVKDFHAAVLEDGAVPLTVLTTKIERWVDERAAMPATAGDEGAQQ